MPVFRQGMHVYVGTLTENMVRSMKQSVVLLVMEMGLNFVEVAGQMPYTISQKQVILQYSQPLSLLPCKDLLI